VCVSVWEALYELFGGPFFIIMKIDGTHIRENTLSLSFTNALMSRLIESIIKLVKAMVTDQQIDDSIIGK
jgi:hypothetical protein